MKKIILIGVIFAIIISSCNNNSSKSSSQKKSIQEAPETQGKNHKTGYKYVKDAK